MAVDADMNMPVSYLIGNTAICVEKVMLPQEGNHWCTGGGYDLPRRHLK
jgi:hypothetical protein